MNPSPKTRAGALLKYFTSKGRQDIPRRDAFERFTSEEFVHLCQLLGRRDARDVLSYISTHRAACMKLTVEDVEEVRRTLLVKDVLED